MQDNFAKILIVDDEPELRELLAAALDDSKLSIKIASSGKEAIELATTDKPDLIITDLFLGDISGLEVLDTLAGVPAVVITGHGDPKTLSEVSRRRPLEMMTKPLNLQRLKETISAELHKLHDTHETVGSTEDQLRETCESLSTEYRKLSQQFQNQQTLLRFQAEMISAKTDDDVFRSFFRTFVRQSGQVYGCALVCDSNAELKVSGRFGVPKPDTLKFCQLLSEPLIDMLLCNPVVQEVDAMDEFDLFDKPIQRYLPGITILAIPLIPAPGEMIGMVMLYRKGEQPFTKEDTDLAQMLAYPTALAVRRND